MPSPHARSRAVTAATTAASVAGLLGIFFYLDIPNFLNQRIKSRRVEARNYPVDQAPSLAALQTLTQQVALKETYPLAATIEKNIPIYRSLRDGKWPHHVQDEWHQILLHGPGVFVIEGFFQDLDIIDSANAAYASIIERELAINGPKGDHFAQTSANSRIWNSFSKHCLQDPRSFVKYYSNPLFRLVCEAWLGPSYRLTAQVNVVKPGGQAQVSHRDYHLGFQTAEETAKWPKAMHVASQLLTLQGAVAHTDMPLDSGPTRLLPFSQLYGEGFMAYRRPEFVEYFLQNYVSLALKKGDAIFFNPALFHAAGENRTMSFDRSANLIQVSSAFGKTMESIDTVPLVERSWDFLAEMNDVESQRDEVDAFICAVAEGYPFPTNLDRRPPAPGGMAPESEQDVLKRALEERWNRETVVRALVELNQASSA